jgi:hypothetical protein
MTPALVPSAQWLVLAYLAGDNDLEGVLLGDLAEMERVGSRPGSVEMLAQLDRAPGGSAADGDWRTARRYYVLKTTEPGRRRSRLLADLGETNTGDPRVLEDFVAFGAEYLRAKKTALILSNHGSGIYVPPEMDSARPAASRHRRRHFFHTTRERFDPARGVAYDDTSGDCLDNLEITRVLAKAHRTLGQKVDVLGLDACLMTMLEVAYQLRDHVDVLVGSEALEPGPGWPHDTILAGLTRRPQMTAAELGATIVSRYVEAYDGSGTEATQSAIALDQLDDLATAVDALAAALLADLTNQSMLVAILRARSRTLRFFEDSYVDVHHFARELASATDREKVQHACRDVCAIIDGDGTQSPIIAAGHVGEEMAPARGLSIYFPSVPVVAHYETLDLARRTRWGEFLAAYLGSARAPEAR